MGSLFLRLLKSDRSFFVFSRQHLLRRAAIAVVQSSIFHVIALCMIVANCVTLATIDPCETYYDSSSLIVECPTPKCFWLRSIDAIVLAFFTLEMLLKMVALCVVGHRASYLADSWNRLDALIVLFGTIDFFLSADKSSNVTLLRLVRVLRPLRAIRRIPNLRLLVTLLFDTLTALSNVCIIVVFVYFVFGITGLQLWAGVLRQRCYLQPESWQNVSSSVSSAFINDDEPFSSGHGPPMMSVNSFGSGQRSELESEFILDSSSSTNDFDAKTANYVGSGSSYDDNITNIVDLMPAYYLSQSHPEIVCGGYFQCSSNVPEWDRQESLCGAIFPEGNQQCDRLVKAYTECRPLAQNPNGISFDNIGAAWVTIFQAVSLEGWTDIMYMVQDGHTFWVWPYFILLVIFGSFASTNLCFVVIATQIPQTKRRLAIAIRNEKLGLAPSKTRFPEKRRSTVAAAHNSRKFSSRFPMSNKEWHKHFYHHPSAMNISVYTQVIDYITDLFAFYLMTLRERWQQKHHAAEPSKEQQQQQQPEQRTTAEVDNNNKMEVHVVDSINNESNNKVAVVVQPVARPARYSKKDTDPTLEVIPNRLSTISSATEPSSSYGDGVEHEPRSSFHLVTIDLDVEPLTIRQNSTDVEDGFHTPPETCTALLPSPSPEPSKITIPPLSPDVPVVPRSGFYFDDSQLESTSPRLSRLNESVNNFIYSTRVWLHGALDHWTTHWAIALLIVVNTVCLATEHHDQSESLTHTVEIISLVVTLVFAIEFLAKLYAYGFYQYIRDGFNMLDMIILVVCIIELVESARSGLSVLRTFRLIRFLKLLRFFPTLQRQLAGMMRTLDNIATFLLLLGLFFIIFSMIGMSLFGCVYYKGDSHTCRIPDSLGEYLNESIIEPGDRPTCRRWRAFDSPLSSLLTVLQVLTQDDGWSQVMRDAMHNVGSWAAIYFVLLVIFGSYVLLSMLLAIIEVGLTRNFGMRKNSVYASSTTATRHASSARSSAAVGNGDTPNLLSPIMSCNSPISEVDVNVEELEALNAANDANQSQQENGAVNGPSNPVLRALLTIKLVRQLREAVIRCLASPRFSRDGDYSLFLLSPQNKLRHFLFSLVTSTRCDQMVLLVILFNCIVVGFERPTILEGSFERKFLDMANHGFNIFFIVEAFLKIIAMGFIYGPTTYLRNGWNIFDFCLVSLSLIEFLIELNEARFATAAIKALHILRLFHTFRPLRAINRAPGLKMVIKTLATTVKPIGTIILITLCIFFVFGVLGVQLYRGCFYKCRIVTDKSPQLAFFLAKRQLLWTPAAGQVLINASYLTAGQRGVSQLNESLISALPQIKTKQECVEHEGLEWTNEENNFDSLGHALMTLFVLLSFDGWKDIAQNGLNCVAVDRQPILNYNPWHLVFFMSFLMINGFCLVDMFAGVVVNNYSKVKEALEKETYAKLDAVKDAEGLEAVSVMFVRRRGGLAPQMDETRLQYWLHYPKWRLAIHQLCTHRYFEVAIEVTIGFNMLAMAVEHYMMPHEMQIVVRIVNMIVLLAFIFEAAVRLVAFGPKRYFRDRWHLLDLTIIILSIFGVALESVDTKLLPINPSVVRAARVCRVTRIFRLVKMATGIQGLFQTVLHALPQVGNLSLLLLLLFFIYGSLGVEIFGKIEGQHKLHGISRHANFQNIGMSTLALFRIATGDRWHELLNDVLFVISRPYCVATATVSPEYHGDDNANSTAASIDTTNVNPTLCAIVSLSTQFYFVSFIILVQFVLINVVVTVLMRQLEETDRKEIFDRARQRMAKHEESMAAFTNRRSHHQHQHSRQSSHYHLNVHYVDTTGNSANSVNNTGSEDEANNKGVNGGCCDERGIRLNSVGQRSLTSPKFLLHNNQEDVIEEKMSPKSILKAASPEGRSPSPKMRLSTKSCPPERRGSLSSSDDGANRAVGADGEKEEVFAARGIQQRRRSSSLPSILRVRPPIQYDGQPYDDDDDGGGGQSTSGSALDEHHQSDEDDNKEEDDDDEGAIESSAQMNVDDDHEISSSMMMAVDQDGGDNNDDDIKKSSEQDELV